MISSLGKDNNPEISYAPFVMIDNKIYLYLSKAANHYYNLRDNHKCSVMVIEDESTCKTIFARTRVSFKCEANMMDSVSDEIFAKFDEVHDAKMMSMFKNMDFDMFELEIKSGRLVMSEEYSSMWYLSSYTNTLPAFLTSNTAIASGPFSPCNTQQLISLPSMNFSIKTSSS